jgi:hypothetical protein
MGETEPSKKNVDDVNDDNSSHSASFQVQDSSIGGSSDDEDLLGVIRGPSTFANAFLYIGELGAPHRLPCRLLASRLISLQV